MTTGAPPPNLTFNSSRDIPPSITVQTRMYNEAGYIAHPLQQFGQAGGVTPRPNRAGTTGNLPGGIAWQAGHPHLINGRQPGS